MLANEFISGLERGVSSDFSVSKEETKKEVLSIINKSKDTISQYISSRVNESFLIHGMSGSFLGDNEQLSRFISIPADSVGSITSIKLIHYLDEDDEDPEEYDVDEGTADTSVAFGSEDSAVGLARRISNDPFYIFIGNRIFLLSPFNLNERDSYILTYNRYPDNFTTDIFSSKQDLSEISDNSLPRVCHEALLETTIYSFIKSSNAEYRIGYINIAREDAASAQRAMIETMKGRNKDRVIRSVKPFIPFL